MATVPATGESLCPWLTAASADSIQWGGDLNDAADFGLLHPQREGTP